MTFSPCRPISRATRRRVGRLIVSTQRFISWHPKLAHWTGTKAALRRHLAS